jgi:hypothetical protein
MRLRIIFFLVAIGRMFAADNYLPPKNTPGVVNPLVTQSNIQKTVCKSGWTKVERPSASYTDKLKVQQMAKLGLKGDPHNFEEDHLISLEIGGAPSDPDNLWPQPWPAARLKDVVETHLKREVCSGSMTLVEAQRAIRTDWTAVYLKITGKTVAAALKAK